MLRKTRILGCLAAVTLIAAGCTSSPDSEAEAAGTQAADDAACSGAVLQIAQANPGYPRLPVYVALHGGFFADQGLDVRVAETDAGADAAAALIGGSADVSPGTYSDVLLAQSRGAGIVAFAATGYEEISNLVMKTSVMQEKGITADSTPEEKVQALEGLRIGVTSPGSSTDLLVRGIMIQQGLDPDRDASITPVGASAMASAFSRGQLDAFALSSPSANAAAAAGDGEVLLDFSAGDYPGISGPLSMTLNTSPATAESKAQELRCFSAGLTSALELMKSDPERAKEIAWEEFDGVVDREAYDATIDVAVDAFAENTSIDAGDAEARKDFIAQVEAPVGDLDVADTYVDLG